MKENRKLEWLGWKPGDDREDRPFALPNLPSGRWMFDIAVNENGDVIYKLYIPVDDEDGETPVGPARLVKFSNSGLEEVGYFLVEEAYKIAEK